jgi:hypothetical protein
MTGMFELDAGRVHRVCLFGVVDRGPLEGRIDLQPREAV